MGASTKFIACDPEAEALLPDLLAIATKFRPVRGTVRVSVTDGPSRARLLGPPHLQINRKETGRPCIRGVLAHEYAHLADPLRPATALCAAALFILTPAVLFLWLLASAIDGTPPESLQLTFVAWSLLPVYLVGLALSRWVEYRVDRLAADALGPDVDALLAMFEDLEARPEKRIPTWRSTHPQPRDRYKAIAGAPSSALLQN